ncbi:hypothetical protein SEPCBS119000_006751, partial [Sporothrix epigloea]
YIMSQPPSQEKEAKKPRIRRGGNPPGWRWTHEQHLFLVSCLADLHRDGHLNSTNQNVIMNQLRRVQPLLAKRWPEDVWDEDTIRSRYKHIRAVWRAFEDLYSKSGVEFNEQSGRLETTDANWNALIARNPDGGPKLKRSGLAIGGNVTMDTYKDIFFNDQPAARHVTEASDFKKTGAGSARSTTPQSSASTPHPESSSFSAREEVSTSEDPMVLDDDSVLDGEEQATITIDELPDDAAMPQTVESGSGQRDRGSLSVPSALLAKADTNIKSAWNWTASNNGKPFTSIKRMNKLEEDESNIEEIKVMLKSLLSRQSSGNRERELVLKPPGQETVVPAVRDCYELFAGREDRLAAKACELFRKDANYAIVYQALPSKEAKLQYLETAVFGNI